MLEEHTVAATIASMTDRDVAKFIQEQSSRKMLSHTMKMLNKGALSADVAQRQMAMRAIRKLGFI